MDLKEYGEGVRKLKAQLKKRLQDGKEFPGQPPFEARWDPDKEDEVLEPVYLFITSVAKPNSKGGFVSVVNYDRGCRHIYDGTHALSTKQEIDDFVQEHAERRQALKEDAVMKSSPNIALRDIIESMFTGPDLRTKVAQHIPPTPKGKDQKAA